MSGGLLFLIDKCDVLRRSVTAQAYGGKPTYAAHLTAVPCRYTEKQVRGFNAISSEWESLTVSGVQVESSRDIQEGDRITNITERGELTPLGNSAGTASIFNVDSGSIKRRGHMGSIRMLTLKATI